MEKFIQHRGIVKNIENNTVFVRIEQESACSSCHVRSACLVSDKKEKIIAVRDRSGKFEQGEEVIVSVKSSLGMRAVMIAFAIPFIILVAALLISAKLSGNEDVGGLMGLLFLFPYYFTLYLLRDKINKKFIFKVSKTATIYASVIN